MLPSLTLDTIQCNRVLLIFIYFYLRSCSHNLLLPKEDSIINMAIIIITISLDMIMLSKRNQFQEVHDADSTFNTELDGVPQTEPDQVKELADPKGYTSSFSLVLHPLYSALTRVPAQHMACRSIYCNTTTAAARKSTHKCHVIN